MTTYRTPGVYIEEISKLPASIAPVATAVPAFIGYVQNYGTHEQYEPVRVESLLEYEGNFGGAFAEEYAVTIDDNGVAASDPADWSPYLLYHQVQMFFANGGGAAWIIPAGEYAATAAAASIDSALLDNGLSAAAKVDEVTLLCIPEAVNLDDVADHKTINNNMLAQCAELQDRFALMEVRDSGDTLTDADDFRDNQVGITALKYGAAYYPSVKTNLAYGFDPAEITVTDSRSSKTPIDLSGPLADLTSGTTAASAASADVDIAGTLGQLAGAVIEITDGVITETYTEGAQWAADGGSWGNTLTNIQTAVAGSALATITATDPSGPHLVTFEAITPGTGGNSITVDYDNTAGGGATNSSTPLADGQDQTDNSRPDLYRKAVDLLRAKKLNLHPVGAVAGVYARVDSDRGVWKAPANTDVRRVSAPATMVTHSDQGLLNIDPNAGKSINVIREFTGRGNLVWGARTLAGNDNEWRYVPVRRFFNFVEESVKKATEAVVFEPNDANTWLKVKAMIENFLTLQWRQGALQGATTEEAFYVSVGLGTTMTQDDILNGVMNVEIGMAAVRPAEFIVLKFSHFIQNS